MPSAFKDIISQLQRQKAAIDRAIAALQEVGDIEEAEPRKPAKKAARKVVAKKAATKRTLSAEARKRISEAVKKRWAETKKAAKKSSAKSAA